MRIAVWVFVAINASSLQLQAQVKVGNNASSVHSSAAFEVESTDRGFLPPRLTTAERDAISSPAEGLTVYNITNKALEFFDGTNWISAIDGSVVTSPFASGYVHCGTATVINEVTNSVTGKIWMDRNLGSSRIATSTTDAQSYGSLFQWGRGADGHQCVHRFSGDGVTTSSTTSTLSSVDQPGNAFFITTSNPPDNWRDPQNTNLWQGVNGINNPCPAGFRVPTEAEWDTERQSWTQAPISSTNNASGAFASPLKLIRAGFRISSGIVVQQGAIATYSSSTIVGTDVKYLDFDGNNAQIGSFYPSAGLSVRCIKE